MLALSQDHLFQPFAYDPLCWRCLLDQLIDSSRDQCSMVVAPVHRSGSIARLT
jgi:hypothetical protein